MLDEQLAHDRLVVGPQGGDVDELGVDPAVVEVEDVGHSPGHAGGEVAPGRPEDEDGATGHVLAAVVADALDDRGRAGVADAEALADQAAQEELAGRGAVADDVAGDDVGLGLQRGGAVGTDDDRGHPTGPCRRSRWRRRAAAA